MPLYPIHFFSEDIVFTLKHKLLIRSWIAQTIKSEDYTLGELNFIFCSDDYLLKINQEFLNHNTYTDIVTFDNSETPKNIIGDIFISIERVRENALKFRVSQRDELHRVIIHGTLHLLGYTDKNKKSKTLMTLKEDEYLAKRSF
ncbi:rRNA maturation RNase YbeY [Daejeonella oryzae]|uniref:rRNA maturation RNase YbeY n=1 Tax=Daejeonella oryzae TaxID=1122943 RepID=UPI00040BC83C|nr:rRNA maturation RNase YbeY [Daejeonella oryzae]